MPPAGATDFDFAGVLPRGDRQRLVGRAGQDARAPVKVVAFFPGFAGVPCPAVVERRTLRRRRTPPRSRSCATWRTSPITRPTPSISGSRARSTRRPLRAGSASSCGGGSAPGASAWCTRPSTRSATPPSRSRRSRGATRGRSPGSSASFARWSRSSTRTWCSSTSSTPRETPGSSPWSWSAAATRLRTCARQLRHARAAPASTSSGSAPSFASSPGGSPSCTARASCTGT